MRGVAIHRHPQGPRLYVSGQRVHHGASGLALAGSLLAMRKHRLCLAALAIVAHDAHDWRVWFSREKFPVV